jgi:hypothetical protein
MTFLRNVLHDLVEKKLWPVAIALVLALVAVPVVLGGGSGTSSADDAGVATSNGLESHRDVARATVVSLEEQAAGKLTRDGKLRNPFAQHHVPKAPEVANQAIESAKNLLSGGSSSGGSSSSSGGSSSSSGGGSSTTPAASTPSSGGTTTPTAPKKTTPKATPSDDSTFHVDLKFGETDQGKAYKNVARLTPLPSSTDPFFVFLGLKDDGKTAVFLISADAVPSGDGVCKPSADSCETVELKKGDIEFFDLQTGTAGVVQYQLELTSIDKGKAATKASAARAHTRESKAGREYLRAVMADQPDLLQGWDFSAKTGLLVDKTADLASGDIAHLPPGLADAADGDVPDAAVAPQP